MAACVIMYQRVHCRNSKECLYWISLYVVIKARHGGNDDIELNIIRQINQTPLNQIKWKVDSQIIFKTFTVPTFVYFASLLFIALVFLSTDHQGLLWTTKVLIVCLWSTKKAWEEHPLCPLFTPLLLTHTLLRE